MGRAVAFIGTYLGWNSGWIAKFLATNLLFCVLLVNVLFYRTYNDSGVDCSERRE